jgi:zinc protease
MNRKFSIIGLLFIGILCLTGSNVFAERTIDKIKYPPLNEIVPPTADTVRLMNGIKVFLIEDHELPIVRARVRLAAGEFLNSEDKAGLADICGQVMRTGGTANMTGDEIDEALESIGASVEVSIGRTNGSARMNILSEYVDTGLQILADVLRSPQFVQDKIDLAKTSERTSISSRNDDAFDVCAREFRKVIYGKNSPYTTQPEYATIDGITRDDLIEFHKKYITPENVMIAVWGDFDRDKMISKLTDYFGTWTAKGEKVPMLPDVDYQFKPGVHYIAKDDVTQSTVLVGHIGGKTGDPDYFALTVANNVLGGSFGSRMFNNVRSKKGLAYSTGANFTTRIAYPGIYYNYVITKLGTTVEATQAVLDEIRRMQTDPPTPDELSAAKESYLNSFAFNFDSKGEIINRMMDYDYFHFPQDFLMTVRKNIQNVTAEDVVDVAKRRFHPDEMQIVVVGKADQFDQPLSVLGAADTIDISIPSGEKAEEIAVNEETLSKGMDLLKKAVKACGGADGFGKVESTSMNATLKLNTPQGEVSLETESIFVLPDKSKEIINLPMGQIITVNNGETGWMKQGDKVVDMAGKQLEDAKEEDFRNTLMLFKEIDNPDFQAVYVNTGEFDGKPVDFVKISSLDGTMSFKLGLDAETGIPVSKSYFGETMLGPGNITQTYSDYRDVSGIKIPFAISVDSDGNKIADIIIKDYKLNADIPADTFDKP